ncbi:MAG TPA: type IV pilus modification protein PilV [Solimonas sp.]|nr:type IV pilus modification protein PilV [Solimonas sp.]
MSRRLSQRRARGFSLVEVLVTTFVLAFSLLTSAGLQIISKKANSEALQRSSAAQLAQDIVERMRANPVRASSYVVADALALTTPATDCRQGYCNGAQLASYDLWNWARVLDGGMELAPDHRAAGGLMDPTGCISGADGLYIVTIAWRGIGTLPAAAPGEDASSACGAGKAAYLDESGASLRRVLVMRTYVAS